MTGSVVFNRQHSSAAGSSNFKTISRPKLRRCSSVDDHNSFDLTVDEDQSKIKIITKYDPTSSDNDSGIEDFDQQIVNHISAQSNDVNDEQEKEAEEEEEEEEEKEEEEELPCFEPYTDENSSEPIVQQFVEIEPHNLDNIYYDLTCAAKIPHDEKKEFCSNTSVVFHGEFSRLTALPIALNYPGVHYYLSVEEAFDSDPCQWPNFAYVKLDNAKAQFKCPNNACGRLWTSMRARISFKISYPSHQGFVVLKVYGQQCQSCNTPADALWYMEEVCRVMDNLSKSIFETFFPSYIPHENVQDTETIESYSKYSRRSRHDPQQRKGKMHAPHNKSHCEACQRGWCFA